MCGIAGYAGAHPPGEALLHRMVDALIHRGPDQDGYLRTDRVAMGMRRLSIIGVETGRQPIFNEDHSVAVVFNGEIYNFAQLRADLEGRGHHFATQTDTECIVHLYEDHGDDCVTHLRGMFAFALWDERRNRLLLARDRAGKKPLFYRQTPGGVWFGSELKAILQDDAFTPEVDPVSLHRYLAFGYVPQHASILAGVAKVPPAQTIAFGFPSPGGSGLSVTQRRYWRLDYEHRYAGGPVEAAEELRGLIREATAIRLVSERPLGAFLSGGVDSSLVVAAMAEQASGPVRTFSIGFEDPRYDERSYARLVAQRFGTEHEELVVRPQIQDLLPRLTWHYDEPFADSSAIPSFYLAEMARRHVVVALNGDGGDESFGGYERYVAQRVAARLAVGGKPGTGVLRQAVLKLPQGQHRSNLRRARAMLSIALASPAARYAELVAVFRVEDLAALYSPEMAAQVAGAPAYQPVTDVLGEYGELDPGEAALATDVRTYLPGDLLVKMDIASMAHSLEARSPLLDHRVMEFAASLPAAMKIRGRTGKWLLKEAARGWLPDEVLDRPKMGFGVPLAAWFRGELADLTRDALTDATARGRGYFQAAAVQRLLDEHQAGRDHSPRIWALLSFELWHRMFVDQRALSPPASGAAA